MAVASEGGNFPVFEASGKEGECAEPVGAHWLPALAHGGATGGGLITKCRVKEYFLVEDEMGYDGKTSNKLSAFRGRELRGKDLDCGDMHGHVILKKLDEEKTTELFDCVKYVASGPVIDKVTVWNHDEVPLRSDEAPQCFALARAMDAFGQAAVDTTSSEVEEELARAS
ncbi:hypothetical protein FOZ63_026541 [Perkinsus olseni]|uniref:Uncharacterized protein n=2 Tax=Perkinsus olseni TaxID=32597 RepID=A0A7J6TZF9_PEROL|nr:hypothetical protein FOZ63_026541 [Perkinsus olseni]